MRCLVPGASPVTRFIFCKDGREAASQVFSPGPFTYHLTRRVSGPGDAGNFSCWYQHRSDNKELLNSNLSLPRMLRVTGAQDGAAAASPVVSSWRRPRQPGTGGPGHDAAAGVGDRHGGPGSGEHTEGQLHYADIGQFCTSKTLPPVHYDMVTYEH